MIFAEVVAFEAVILMAGLPAAARRSGLRFEHRTTPSHVCQNCAVGCWVVHFDHVLALTKVPSV